jgi:hypothetical protein
MKSRKTRIACSLLLAWLVWSLGALWHFEARDAFLNTLCITFGK